MKRTQIYLITFIGLVILIVYSLVNKDYMIREHLTDAPPTLFSLQSGLKDTDEKVAKLTDEFNQMKSQASAQASQAAAAKAQLSAAKSS